MTEQIITEYSIENTSSQLSKPDKVQGYISSKQHKDLIGQTINLATKIQSAAGENEIIIGHTMLVRLGVYRRKLFEEYKKSGWDYKLTNTQHAYPLYKLGDITLY